MPRLARTVLLLSGALVLLGASCSSSDDATSDTTTASDSGASTDSVPDSEPDTVRRQPEAASSFFAINEVGLGPDGYVALTNFTDVPVTLAGLFLCQRPDYIELPDEEVAPGETVLVALGDGSGLDGRVVATNVGLGELRPSDGEIGLYTSNDFGNPVAMIEYLEWGSTPHGRTDVAVAAGLWPEGSFAPTAETATRLFRVEESGLWLFEPNE